jgi:hypothetical protein
MLPDDRKVEVYRKLLKRKPPTERNGEVYRILLKTTLYLIIETIFSTGYY